MSDPSLLRDGARVGVRGFFPRSKVPNPQTITLWVIYPTDDGSDGPAYLAYGPGVHTGRAGLSNPVSFNIPVTAQGRLGFAIESSSGGVARSALIWLAVNPSGGSLPLNRGVYVVAPLEEEAAQPLWSTVKLRADTTAASLDPRGEGLVTTVDDAPVPFDYFVVTIADPKLTAVTSSTTGAEDLQ